MSDYAISLRAVEKRFGIQQVLTDVNVQWATGNIHGIVGRNGSGKTVLMKLICGFMAADNGEIAIHSIPISKSTSIPKGIGAIIEAPGFLPHHSGFKNLKFLALIGDTINDHTIRKTMQMVGLDPTLKKRVGAYSLGMRQRLGIAQAIMENPDILILDEPMNGLDNAGVRDMRKLFLDLKAQGKTILLASHNKEDINELCDTVHEMDAGVLKRIL